MEQPIHNDGPDYPDGTDAEGFPGGDRRFGLIKPTKEEVEAFRLSVSEVDCINNPATAAMIMKQKSTNLCDAYLALREEVEEIRKALLKADKLVTIQLAMLERSKADNEALKERLESAEQESKRVIENVVAQ